jgi:Tripartite tricarboxylate transporter TctB family
MSDAPAGLARRADFWSGLLFAGIGAAALWVGADYSMGVPSRIGPGYVPRLLGILMGGIGIFLVVRSWWTTETIDTTIAWRPTILILAAVAAFAFAFDATGLVPAIMVTVGIATFAVAENRWYVAIVLGAILAFFAWALFVKGLSMPIPVWTR